MWYLDHVELSYKHYIVISTISDKFYLNIDHYNIDA